MKIDANSREEYFVVSGSREAELRALDKIIQEAAPDLEPILTGGKSGKMLGYGAIKYKPKSAKIESEWPLIVLAAHKNYISLYACAIIDGTYIADKYQSKLGNVNCGKSCIRFTKLIDLDLHGVREMLADLNTRFMAGEKLYGF